MLWFRLGRQILQDGGAERSHSVVGVEDHAFAVRGYIADSVDVSDGCSECGELGFHAIGGRKPGFGQPGRIRHGAGGVDVDVYGRGGTVGEVDNRLSVFVMGGGYSDVVLCRDAELAELRFGSDANIAAEARQEAGATAEDGSGELGIGVGDLACGGSA